MFLDLSSLAQTLHFLPQDVVCIIFFESTDRYAQLLGKNIRKALVRYRARHRGSLHTLVGMSKRVQLAEVHLPLMFKYQFERVRKNAWKATLVRIGTRANSVVLVVDMLRCKLFIERQYAFHCRMLLEQEYRQRI